MINVAILATPRTGSNYLCECLTQTGAFGKVDGFFVGTGELLSERFEDNCKRWFSEHGSTGIHACKFSLDYMDHILQYVSLERLQWLMSHFTHYIHLSRRNRVAQAVSYYIADATKQWTSQIERIVNIPDYDYWRIAWYYSLLSGLIFRANSYMNIQHVPSLALFYEDMNLDTRNTLTEIANFAGITLPDFELKPTLHRQIMPEKDAYIVRFRKELEKELEYVR